jgi:oligosaccharide repeat unit polymerase
MGGTLKTVAYVVRFVPETRDYDWGRSYLWSLFSLVPNFTSDLHPSARRSISLWLITSVDPYTAARGGGLGFSFLAEAYLNFGWAGIVIVAGLIGYFLSSLDQWVEFRLEPMACACVAVILVFFSKYARADSLEITRALVWYCLVPYFCCMALSRYRLDSVPSMPGLPAPVPRLH